MYVNLYVTRDGVFTEDGRKLTPSGQSIPINPSSAVPNGALPHQTGGFNQESMLGGGGVGIDAPTGFSAAVGNEFACQPSTAQPQQFSSPNHYAGGVHDQNSLRGGAFLSSGHPDFFYDPFGLGGAFDDESIRGGTGPADHFNNPNVLTINCDDLAQGGGGQGIQVFTIDASGNLVPMDPSQAGQATPQPLEPYDPFQGIQIEIDGVPVDLNAAMTQQVGGTPGGEPQPRGPQPGASQAGGPGLPPGPPPPKPPRGVISAPPGPAPPKPPRGIPRSQGSQGGPPPAPPPPGAPKGGPPKPGAHAPAPPAPQAQPAPPRGKPPGQ